MSIQRRSLLQALAATPVVAAAASLAPKQANTYQVKEFGAKGDGKTLDTAAIQTAIDAAAKTQGTVIFDGGVYLSGSLFLKSGVTSSG